MSMTIRAAVPGDEQRLAILNGFVQGLHVTRRPDCFKPSTLDEVTEQFRVLLKDSSTRTWIAEEAGEAIGYVLTMLRKRHENPFFRPRRWCELDHLAVTPGFRRRGVASALIQKAVTAAVADGFTEVELCTWAFNAEAQALFRKLGFEPQMLRWERKMTSGSMSPPDYSLQQTAQ